MSILKSIFFGLVMGLTRILPVSAGAHQQVLFRLFGVTQGALLSLLCHVGILAALYWDNRVLLSRLGRERKLAAIPPRRRKRPLDTQILLDGRLARTAAIFSGVGVLAAIFLGTFDSLPVLAGMLFLNGVLVLLPQFLPTANKDSRSMTRLDGILMGLGGALGAVPGFSQTGRRADGCRGPWGGPDEGPELGAAQRHGRTGLPVRRGFVRSGYPRSRHRERHRAAGLSALRRGCLPGGHGPPCGCCASWR